MNLAAFFRGTGAAKKQPGLSTELEFNNMATITKIPTEKQPQAGTVHWLNECIERGKNEVFTETVLISAGLAAQMLGRNPGNRIISEKKVEKYARDMIAGRWAFNGETIIFSNTGELNNGQHRLYAIIEANCLVRFLIAFGLERETRVTIDQGMARTAGHYLSMLGFENSKACAAIANIVMAYERSGGTLTRLDTTHTEITARVIADPAIGEAAHFSSTTQRFAKGILSPSQIGACFYLFADVHAADAAKYMKQLCLGENIKRGDPAFTVRQTLSEMKGERRQDRIEATMRGWIAFRQGRVLKHVKFLNNLPALI